MFSFGFTWLMHVHGWSTPSISSVSMNLRFRAKVKQRSIGYVLIRCERAFFGVGEGEAFFFDLLSCFCWAQPKTLELKLKEVAQFPWQILRKIENQEGINNIDEIIEATDGVMVARWRLSAVLRAIPGLESCVLRQHHLVGPSFQLSFG